MTKLLLFVYFFLLIYGPLYGKSEVFQNKSQWSCLIAVPEMSLNLSSVKVLLNWTFFQTDEKSAVYNQYNWLWSSYIYQYKISLSVAKK